MVAESVARSEVGWGVFGSGVCPVRIAIASCGSPGRVGPTSSLPLSGGNDADGLVTWTLSVSGFCEIACCVGPSMIRVSIAPTIWRISSSVAPASIRFECLYAFVTGAVSK